MMRTMIHCLLVLILVPAITCADTDTLDYLYSPDLSPAQDNLLQRVNIQARNENFPIAIELSQSLLDDAEPLQESASGQFGQLLVNHGIIHSAAGEYDLGRSIISRGIALLERTTNPFDDLLINALMAKAISELNLTQLEAAEDTFRRAQHITHREAGVYNDSQLIMVNYLTATHLRSGDASAADRQQLFSLRVAEQAYGPESVDLLPTLSRLGSYFASRGSNMPIMVTSEMRVERDILFKNAIGMYDRAIEIIEKNYGENDLRLVEPLRGLASARMLQITSRRAAEDALLRSQQIVESNPNSDITDRAQALVDLGDLYTILSNSEASSAYLNAWQLLAASPETRHLAISMFEDPIRLFPRRLEKIYLERSPDAATEDDELFVAMEFTITTEGNVDDMRVIEKNVPNEQVRLLRQRIRTAKYRPRIIDGVVVPTEAYPFRQQYVVISQPTPISNEESD